VTEDTRTVRCDIPACNGVHEPSHPHIDRYEDTRTADPGGLEQRLLDILPDVLSVATEMDGTYEYSCEPGSPYVRILAADIARRLTPEATAPDARE
jgi:hypothetical protein